MAGTAGTYEHRNQEATLYVGNVDESVDDEVLWELFAQAGPVAHVHIPRDKVTGRTSGFAFVEMKSEADAEYALKVMNMIKLAGKMLKVNKATADKNKLVDVGAHLFVGNLDASVDEKVMYDTFVAFGNIAQHPKVQRDPDTGASRGFGFVTYDSFEAADLAIECMNGRFLGGRQVVVQYALKAGSKTERHGSAAERALAAAASGSKGPTLKPHTHFATAPGQVTSILPSAPVPMVGQTPMPPPMLPPTAILPASMMPPPLPSHTAGPSTLPMHAASSGMPGLMPPPLPNTSALLPPPLLPGPLLPGGPRPPSMPGMPLMGFPGMQGMPGMPGMPGGFVPGLPPYGGRPM